MSTVDIDVAGEFPGTVGGPYLDTAARGLLPRSAHAAITASLDSVLMGTADKSAMFASVERARERFAKLINAQPGEIAITKNISEGLNIVGAALPWRAGDNVVVCRELEHPNNIFPWANLKQRLGIQIREVPRPRRAARCRGRDRGDRRSHALRDAVRGELFTRVES